MITYSLKRVLAAAAEEEYLFDVYVISLWLKVEMCWHVTSPLIIC
jgi:hypothetical protein